MPCEIKTPIAGSVSSHVASIGQRVESGATVMLVECMKTDFTIDAPQSGIVVSMKACGEIVEADEVVATLDDEPTTSSA